jgi:hypothetical protein
MSSIYSVIHIKIPEEHLSTIHNDVVIKFNEITNKDVLDMIEINKFFTKPHTLIEYHRYVYIGNYTILEINDVIQNIETTTSISTENSAILSRLYDNEFVDKLKQICEIAKNNNEILHLVPYTISNDDTINSIYDILSLSIPQLTNDKIHMFANRKEIVSGSFYYDIRHKILQAATLYRNKTAKGTFNMDSLQFILWSFGVPYDVIRNVISSKYALLDVKEPNDILQILENPLIFGWIKIATIYTSPSYNISQYNHELLYPIFSCPFLYLSSDNNDYYKDDITDVTKSFNVNKKGYKYTIMDVIGSLETTLYIYSASDFKKMITEDNYKYSFLKLFPSLIRSNLDNIVEISKDISDKYKIYNNISSSFTFFNEKIQDKLAGNRTDANYEPLYLELHHRIYNNAKIDLLGIFNSIIPSRLMPLVIFRDSQIKEYIYKIYRRITDKVSIADYEPTVTQNELNKWINYTSYIVESGSIKDIKDVVRGIQIKLLWKTAIYNNILREGQINEIYANYNTADKVPKYCSIKYSDTIIRDIPFNNKFINNYNDNLKINDNINFYQPKKTYIDVSIDSNGHIYIKCPWKYTNIYDSDKNVLMDILNEWINDITPIFNKYMTQLYLTPSLSDIADSWFDEDALSLSRFNTYSRYINGSTYISQFDYRYMIKLPVNIPIDYDKFIKILRVLQSIIVINEPVLKKNDKIDYYDIKKNGWITGMTISDYDIDDNTYTIYKATTRLTGVKRNLLRIPIKKDMRDSEKINEINFTYKKVSDFNLLNTIQQFILKLIQSNMPEVDIIVQIMNEFDLNKEKAYEQYFKYSNKDNENNVKILTYLKFDTGIDITLDYINTVNLDNNTTIGYNIVVKNIHSFMELKNIIKLIQYILQLYLYYDNYEKTKIETNELYIKYVKNYFIKEPTIKEEIIDDTKLEDDANFLMDQDDINYDDIVDLDDALAELQMADIEEEIIEEIKEEEDKKEPEKRPVRIAGRTSNILDMLKMRDNELFDWNIDGKIYSRSCQGKKQPVILTDDEKRRIDIEHPGSYIVDSDINCDIRDNNFMTKIRSSTADVKCSALRYGSSPELQHWYICPRIYDAYARVPLNILDLSFKKSGFKQKDNGTGWRTDLTTGEDILTFEPSYQGRTHSKSAADVTETQSLIFKDDKSTPYPGFINPVDIKQGDINKKIHPPCCLSNHSDGVRGLFTGKQINVRQHGEYILQWGKDLDDNRYGYLSDYLSDCFGNKKCDIDKGNCIRRKGVKNNTQSFLIAISKIVGFNNVNDFIISLLSKLDFNLFNRLNRGQLHNDFKTVGNISTFQNYIEYTLSNEIKLIKHYYDLVTRPLGFTGCENGFNLLIIDYTYNIKKNEYTYDIIIPYYTSLRKKENIIKLPTAVLLRNTKYGNYEIIEYEGKLLFPRGKLPNVDAMIDSIWSLLLQHDNPRYNIAPVNKKLKMLLSVKSVLMFEEAYNYIIKKYKQSACIFDGYQIVGMYINDNKLIVPVYPTDFPDNLSMCITKIQLAELINNRNELSLSLNNYKKELNTLMAELRKEIQIKNVYLEDTHIVGIMTTYAVYVPLKNSENDNTLPAKTNVFSIMKEMNDTERKENENMYVKPSNYEDVISTINNFPNSSYKLVKKDNLLVGILLSKYKNIAINAYYPVIHTTNINDNNEIVEYNNLLINSTFDSYIQNANILYNKNDKIPLRPIRLYMNDNKQINGLLLETGDIIKFNNKYSLTFSKDLEKIMGIVNNIIMNSLSDKLSTLSLNRDKPLYIDDRIIANKNIDYQLNIYDYSIKMLNKFLKEDENDKYRQTFINVLTNNDFTIKQKMRIIRPLFIAILRTLFNISNSDTYDKCEDTIVTIPDIDNIEDYVYNIYIIRLITLSDTEINNLLKNKFGVTNKSDFFSLYKNNINENEINYIQNNLLDIYKSLYNTYNNTNRCVIMLNNEILDVNSLIERLFNDFIRNKIIQDMIINEYSKIEYTERYIQHNDEIIFRSGEGSLMWDKIKQLYDKKLRLYYQNLTSMNDIVYDKEVSVEAGEPSRLSKNNIYNLVEDIDNTKIDRKLMKEQEKIEELVRNDELERIMIEEKIRIENEAKRNQEQMLEEQEKKLRDEQVLEEERQRVEEQEKKLRDEQKEEGLYEPMYLVDILRKYGLIDKGCLVLIFTSFFKNVLMNAIDKNAALLNFKKELQNNKLTNIDVLRLKEALKDLSVRLFYNTICPKLNIVFKLYDNSYIFNPNITDEMKMNKWIMIKVDYNNNIVSFMKSNREYDYNEIRNMLRM